MPDVCAPSGLTSAVAASVNGKNLDYIDFARFKEQFPAAKDGKMDSILLDRFIVQELLWQYTQKLGITASDDRIAKALRNLFTDPATGRYSQDTLRKYMQNYQLTFPKFESLLRRDIAINDFNSSIYAGTSVSKNDAAEEYLCRNSKIQIRYAFLSKQDILKRYAERVTVTDEEINNEMKNNPDEVKDPQTDRERIKEKLAGQKSSAIEDELAARVNAAAAAGRSFAETAAMIQGTTGTSAVFTPGEPLREQGSGKSLSLLENSKIFRESCMSLKLGASSELIRTSGGLYVFTPSLKQTPGGNPAEAELKTIAGEMQRDRANFFMNSIILRFNEESKIIKNLKDN
jgi:hypothetical protein